MSKTVRRFEKTLVLPDNQPGETWTVTDPAIHKTLYLSQLIRAAEEELAAWHQATAADARAMVASRLKERLQGYRGTLTEAVWHKDPKVEAFLDLLNTLAKNLAEKINEPGCDEPDVGNGGYGLLSLSSVQPSASHFSGRSFQASSAGLNVGTGGAQNAGSFRQQVERGQVPCQNALSVEGQLHEFDLQLQDAPCYQLICLHSALAVNASRDQVYVQLSMNSPCHGHSFSEKAREPGAGS